MKKSAPLLLTLVIIACSGPQERSSWVRYSCDDGRTLSLRFNAETASLILGKGQEQALELQQQPVASGFAYGNGKYRIRGKGKEAMLIVGRRAPLKCNPL